MVHRRSQWLAHRGPIVRLAESRRFADDILAELAGGRFRPFAWARFVGRSLARSLDQARNRPAAALEVTALHVLVSLGGSRRWAFATWLLCITHPGLLGERQTLGWPNTLTLVRALLPSLAPASRWTSLVAIATDLADGHPARRGEESAFGAYADPIADGVFWSWYALRWEPNRWLRWAPITLFAALVAGISAAYFARGRSIDYPRPMSVRFASSAAQIQPDPAHAPLPASGCAVKASGRDKPTWSRMGDIPRICFDRRNLSRCTVAAALVGTILFFIN